MAPEYALWGHLTYKADVYSFGVVALEIVSGKNNNSYVPTNNSVCLLEWVRLNFLSCLIHSTSNFIFKFNSHELAIIVTEFVSSYHQRCDHNWNYFKWTLKKILILQACHVQQTGNLVEVIDEKLGSDVDKKEAEIVVKVAILCTNASASLRPTMSEVVSMLEGQISVPDVVPETSSYSGDLRFKSLKHLHKLRPSHSLSGSQTQNSTTLHTFCSTSTSDVDLSEINQDLSSS